MVYVNQLSTPVWLQTVKWILNPPEYMSQAVKEYQDLFTAQITGFGNNILFVNHPDAIQQILTNDRQTFFADGELNTVLTPIVGYSSLLSLDGKRHKRERKLMMPPFHGDRMIYYGNSVQEIVDNLFSKFKTNDIFITRETMQEVSLQVILKVVFGLTEGDRFLEMAQLIKDILDRFNQPINISFLFYEWLRKDFGKWSPWGSFLRIKKRLDDLIYREIEERRKEKNSERVDMLSLLLEAKDENGEGLTNQELRDELMLILFAGHETTAIAMSWALYWIHYYPEVKEKLLQELNTLPPDSDGMTIYKQPYLTAVCNETLRIYPVAMLTFPRVATEDVQLLGQTVKKGTIVTGCIYLTHQREDLYPNPNQFQPERFLHRQYSPYEFLPFGGGVRRCLGEALATYEMRLVVAKILREYDLELVTKKAVKPRRRGVVLSPEGGIPMKFLGHK
ncbi:cytochrome P450 [Cyanobacterium aponinum AL20118]|uniref:Cytochrome P450 n=1 Tax=Cyanobacterium aponinum AL20115 TaxID=3090662 RepID=A0AAF0ZB36_9CHRO|nr:cytochrome P450 [Cyanobacterium aponinum]WPF89746.1 cytochrome P450 [Cyanobacterium aponinum AL20115]